jgi:hypothetical protein
MVTWAMAEPANNTPMIGDAIAHRSVFIVRDLSINREVDVSTERVRLTLAAGRQSTWHGLRPWARKTYLCHHCYSSGQPKSRIESKEP